MTAFVSFDTETRHLRRYVSWRKAEPMLTHEAMIHPDTRLTDGEIVEVLLRFPASCFEVGRQ